MRKFYLALLASLLLVTTGFAQTITMSNTAQNGVCAGTYYDPGGTGNYGNNANFTQTFTPSAGSRMQFVFTAFNTESTFDFLYIYNGNSVGAPLIGKYSGTQIAANTTFSSTAADGSLTFRFTSDGGVVAAGWAATVSCVAVPYRAAFISVNPGAATWCAGETRNISVTVKNTGTATWTNSSPDINIGVKWNNNGANWTDYYIRTDANNLAPGATGTFTLPITASNNIGAGYTTPLAAGTNNLIFDIVEEGVSWFGDNGGNTGPGNAKFTSPNQTITATPTPTFTAFPGATACSGVSVTYTTQTGQSNYVWSVPGTAGTDYTITSGGIGTTNSTVTLKWLTAGSKVVTVNYTTGSCPGVTAASSTTVVSVSPIPTFITSPGATTCSGTDVTYSTQAGQSNYVWSVPGTLGTNYTITSGGIATTSNTVTLKWLTAGSKAVTVNYTTGSCPGLTAASSTTVVSATPAPTYTTLPGATTCSGIDVTYTTQAAQSNYVWSVPGTAGTDYTITSGGIGTTNNTVTLKWLTAGSKAVTVNYTTGSCPGLTAASSTTVVSNTPAPIFTTSPGATTCSGTDVTYTTQAGQSNYIWSVPGTLGTDYTITSGGIGTTSNTVILKWLTAGSKVVTVNYTTGSCIGLTAASSTTAINLSPIANAGGAMSAICQGSITDPLGGSFGGGATSAVWDDGGAGGSFANNTGSTPNTATYTASASSPATVTLTLTTSGGSCGVISDTKDITVYQSVAITTDPGPLTKAVCAASNVSYTVVASGTGLTYQWLRDGNPISNGGRLSGATSSTFNITGATLADNGTYSVVVSGLSPCTSVTSDTAHLDVNQSINITAQPETPQIICEGQPYTIFVSTTGTVATYQWYKNGSMIPGGTFDGTDTYTFTIPNVTVADNGSTYRLLLDDGTTTGGCNLANSNIAVLTVRPTPTATIGGTTTVCQSSTAPLVTFTNPQSLSVTVTYDINGGGTSSIIVAANSSSTVSAPTGTPGTFNYNNVSVAYTTAPGCSNPITGTATITVDPTPDAIATPSTQPVCSGDAITTIVFTSSVGVGTTYAWTRNNTATVTGIAASGNGDISGTLTNTTNAPITVTFTITPTAATCVGPAITATVIVNPQPLVSTKTATICSDGSFTVTPTNGAPTNIVPTGTTYSWSAPTVTGGVTGGTTGSLASSITGTLSNPTNTVQTAIYTVTPISGSCTGADFTVTVTVNPKPFVSPQTTIVCSGTAFSVSPVDGVGGNILPASKSYSWPVPVVTGSMTGGATASGAASITGTLTNNSATPQTATYTVTPTSGTCPGATFTVTVTVNPATPAIAASSAGTGATCSQITANWTASTRATTYFIDVSTISNFASFVTGYNNLDAGNVTTLNVTGLTAGVTYYYRVRANNGCGTSANSAAITYATLPATPNVPIANAGTGATCSQITANWATTANATTYFLDVATDNAFGSMVAGYNNLNVGNVLTINVTGLTAGTTYYYRVRASNSCGTSASSLVRTYATSPATPAVPGSITGTATKCPATSQIYSITAVPTATTYTWTVPTGWSITAGAGTTSITVTTGGAGQNGNITVTAGNSCGTSTASSLAVTVSPGTPAQPGTITGTATVCPGITLINYSIDPVANANTYTWTVPTGWAITAGQGTISMTATSGAAGQNGNIRVTAGNSCGTSSANQSVDIVPLISTNNTGYTTSSAKTSDDITVSTTTTPIRRGYLKFPLSSIPAGSTITGSELDLVNNGSGAVSGAINFVTDLGNNDPVSAAAATLYAAIASGAPYSSITWASVGAIALPLNAAANADIQANISAPGYIAMGMYRGAGSSVYNFYGYSAGANAPVLTVTYSVPGGNLAVVVSPGTPAVPVIKAGTLATCTGITANWNTVTGATAYLLDVSIASDFSSFVTGFNNLNVGNVLTYNVTGLTAGVTYYYRVRATNSCGTSGNSGTTTMATSPAAPATPGTITGDITQCPGTTGQIFSVVAVPNATTYTWTVPTGWNVTNGAGSRSITVTSGAAGQNGNITVTAGNSCGTSAPNTLAVIVNPKPVAGAITGPSTVCIGSGSTITLTPNATGTGPFTYTWSSSNTTTATITNAGVVTGKNVGTTNITYTVTDANGCFQTSANFAVAVTRPTANAITQAAGLDEVCINSTLQLTSNATGVGTLTYTWASSNNARATVTNSGVVTGISAGTANITYTVADGNGCPATSGSFTVTVKAIPTGTITAAETSGNANNDNIICAGAPVVFTATAGFNSYTFKVNGTTVQAGDGTQNTWSSSSLPNGASVTVDVANSLNCGTTFGPITMTVNPLPAPTLIADKTTICKGDLVTFTATDGVSYTFKVNGAPVQISAAGTYQTTDLNGSDVVTVEATNANGCKATSLGVTMIVNPLPAGTLKANVQEICSGGAVTFTANGSFSNYEFFVDGASVQSGTIQTYTTTFTDPSVVTVKVTNSATGCFNYWDTLAINVNALPSGMLSATENSGVADDNSICAGTPVNFTATPGFINYEFMVNGLIKQTGGSNTYSNSTLANNDSVKVKVSNGDGCEAVFAGIKILVAASPVGTLAVSPSATICLGDNITFTATAGFSNYTFKIGSSIEQNGTSNTFSTTSLANGDVVTVDVTNTNTCVTTFNAYTIIANPLPTATLVAVENSGTAVNDGVTCTGATITFTASSGFSNYNFLLNGISIQNGPSNTYVRNNLTTGNKVEVAVSNANNCIALSNAITVTVNPLPAVSPITGTLSACVGLTTTLSDLTAGGTWSSLNTGIASVDASGIVTGVAAGSATILYTVTNTTTGCDSTVSALVTINALPTVAAISGLAGVCVGSTITLTDATTGGTWSSSDDLVASISGTGVVTGVASGSVTITYTITNGNGCVTEVTKSVTVNVLPVLTAITGTVGLCVNTTSTLSSTPSGGVWTSDNKPVATVNASTGVVTAVSAGTTNITYTVTNGAGCVASVSTVVTVNQLPVPTLTGKNPICVGDDEKYITESGQTNYIWNVVGGTITGGGTSIDDTIQVTWTTAGPKSITVNYTNSFGCTAATSSTFTNAPTTTPPSFASGVPVACVNTTGNNYATQSGHTDYTWTVTGGTIESGGTDTDPTITITWTNPGTRSVSVNYSDAFGCNAVSPTVYGVTVNPLPTATISGTATVCEGSTAPTITFTGANGTSPYTFTYTINGVVQPTAVSTDDFATVTQSTATSGSFVYALVSVHDDSPTACSQVQTGTVTIDVSTTPSATISYGGPFCTTASPFTVTQTGTPGGTYSAPVGLTINSSNGTITPSTSTGGTYLVTYTIAAVGGCSVYTATTSVTITDAPSATIAYTGGPFCSSSASVTVAITGTPGGTFASTAGLTIDANSGTITPATSTNGTYTVTYTIAASGGCATFSTNTSVTITTAPSATISYSGSPFCSSAAVVSVTRTGSAGGTYSSAGGLSINATTGAITPSTSAAGTYTVTYLITGTGGCANFSTTTLITITTAPTAIAGTAIPTCAGNGAVNITAGSSASNQTGITWTTSNGTGTFANATSLTTATYTPSPADIVAGTRTLVLTAAGGAGCGNVTSTKTITISAVPSTFNITPGDTTICLGSVIPLSASIGAPIPGSKTASSSATLNLNIPDAGLFGGNGEVSTNLAVSGIPVGAIISSISVNFSSNHNYDQDLVVNLKAPNNNILNLINKKGGNGNGFNTTITSATATPITGNGPITGTHSPDGISSVGGPAPANVNAFSGLFSTPNGTWTLDVQDVNYHFFDGTGRINSWSITINYTVLTPVSAVWTPSTYLYTDASLNTPYAGQSLSTVYTKPTANGTVAYTATSSNVAGCSTTKTVSVTTNPTPVVTITSDYCIVPGKVRLTANSVPAATSYLWSNGAITQSVDVDIAGSFDVTVFGATSCPGKATISVANELITNGNFEAGNVSFISSYPYRTGAGSLDNPPGYAVDTAANYYGPTFLWGKDHTTTHGKFMMVNGTTGVNYQVWQQTINVQPNTTYYFSAWGLELDNLPSPPTPANAKLQFNVNGAQVGTFGNLPRPTNPTRDQDNNQWVRFYGSWTSGPTTTSAVVAITDLQGAVYGNNFGLDDISFGTLSTFINLVSATGTDDQTVCKGSAITDIRYDVGNGSTTGPTVTGLPAGVTSTYSGDLLISGTPTAAPGVYTYSITTTGTCNPTTVTGKITVQGPVITLAAGSTSPSVCASTAVSISFTIGGTATGATVTGLPTGMSGALTGTTFTISGNTAVVGPYPYTVTTTGGTCSPQVSISGTITVTGQTLTLNTIPATANQTVCINTPLITIRYSVGGTANNATVSGLPAGVTGVYSGGFFNITGSPTTAVASPYTYTVSTTGPTCSPISITGTITVTPAATLTLTSAAGTDAQNACNNLAITPITYAVNGGTNASITSGAFPAGVTGSYSGGVYTISGVPTAGGTFNYTISTTGGCGTGTITGSITVGAQTITLASGIASPSLCSSTLMAPFSFTIGGTATGATVTGLPTGVTGSLSGTTFTISGTPTDPAGSYPYTVTTSGSSCDPKSISGTITIQPGAVGGNLTSLNTCTSTSGSLTLSGQTGTIIRWESSTDSSTWSPIVNTTITQNYTNILVPTYYRVVVGNNCSNVFSSAALVGIRNYWTGKVSSDWHNGANWSDGAEPTNACPDVTIPVVTGPNFYPILGSGTATITNLIIKPSATLTVTGATLEIAGTITSTGGFNAGNGTVVFNGTSGQTIAGAMFNGNTIMNLTTSNTNGLTVSGGAANLLNVSGVLSFGSVNNATLNTGDNVVLTSTATGTARVADVTNNGANTGNKFNGIVTVERYFPSRRAWRLFTAPVSAGGNIFNNWQNGGVWTTGKGTYVSGSTAPAGGLDATPQQNSSLKATVALTPVLNTVTTLISRNVADTSDNIPYFIFVRGDRDPANVNINVSNTTTLSSKGKLQIGRQTFPANTASEGFTFLGNPYASPVAFSKIALNNIPRRFWLWDPYINVDQGAYVLLDDFFNTGTYTATPPTTLSKQALQSGQAFFVQTDIAGGPASVVFQETSKSAVSNLLSFRPVSGPIQSLRANFYHSGANDSAVLLDGVMAQFADQFNKAVDLQDAVKATNVKEMVSLKRDNKLLSVERRPVPLEDDTLFLQVNRTTQRGYSFGFEPMDMDPALTAFLEDNYTGNKTPLSLTANTMVDFNISSDAASAAADRFRIVFKRSQPLPVTKTTINAYPLAANIAVEWKVENETNVTRYEVEKSADGVNFAKMNTTTATGANVGSVNYSWLDANPLSGDNFYRIRRVSPDGKFEYTNTVLVKMGSLYSGIRIYPNPVSNGIIGAEFKNMDAGIYNVKLLNSAGQAILIKTINHARGTSMENIKPDFNLASGIYQLEVTSPDKKTTKVKVIVK